MGQQFTKNPEPPTWPQKRISTITGKPEFTTADVERFLLELADALNNSLDLDAVLNHTAELVRKVIPFEIFGILLLNEKTQILRPRFTLALSPDIMRINTPVGQGIPEKAAKKQKMVCVQDITQESNY